MFSNLEIGEVANPFIMWQKENTVLGEDGKRKETLPAN